MTRAAASEWRFALFASAVLVGYASVIASLGAASAVEYARLIADYARVAFVAFVFVGAFVTISVVRRSRGFVREGLAAAARERWQRDRCLSVVVPPLLFIALLTSFAVFKQRVLPHAGFGADAMLTTLDRAMFFGVDPWRITHAVFVGPLATGLLDFAYHAWFAPMALGVMACAFAPARYQALRLRYLISYMLVWIVAGSAGALLLPAAGPCFQSTAIGTVAGFEPLMTQLAAHDAWLAARFGSGLTALQYQAILIELSASDTLALGGGISAMPSLHNALAVLFALAASRINRGAGVVLLAFAALIWVGSVHLGWHYAIDGSVGAGCALLAWFAAGPLAAWMMRAPRPQLADAPAAVA